MGEGVDELKQQRQKEVQSQHEEEVKPPARLLLPLIPLCQPQVTIMRQRADIAIEELAKIRKENMRLSDSIEELHSLRQRRAGCPAA